MPLREDDDGRRTNKQIDAVTGTATTGHEWDGIRELNSRCRAGGCRRSTPRIVWAIGYWIVYPAWPLLTGYTKGMLRLAASAARSTGRSPTLKAARRR